MDIYAAYTYLDLITIVWVMLWVLGIGGIFAYIRLRNAEKGKQNANRLISLSFFYAAICIVLVYGYQTFFLEPNRVKEAEAVHTALQTVLSQKSLHNEDLIITFSTPKGPDSIIVPADIAKRAKVNNSWAVPASVLNNFLLVLGAALLFLALMVKGRDK